MRAYVVDSSICQLTPDPKANTTQLFAMYEPILEYQTRLLCLSGDQGDAATSPLVCTLHAVEVLHGGFGKGLGLAEPAPGQDRLIQYDALSYTWGNNATSEVITCDGSELLVTENLCQALLALRQPETKTRWLWVDAICINQEDDLEKARQIPSMFFIYQQATQVVAWLGVEVAGLDELLHPANGVTRDTSDLQQNSPRPDIESSCAAVQDIYRHPYFRRVWVQQEAFAASRLTFKCGRCEFAWRGILADPTLLVNHRELECLRTQISSSDGQILYKTSTLLSSQTRELYWNWTMREIASDFRYPHAGALDIFADSGWKYLSNLQLGRLAEPERTKLSTILKTRYIRDYDIGFVSTTQTRERNEKRFGLVALLLRTGNLEASDARDFIYSVLPFSGFAHKGLTQDAWLSARSDRTLIPVDYTLSLATLLSVTTWALLMEGGLGVLAKFKLVVSEDNPPGRLESAVPSWAVDWRLSAPLFVEATGKLAANTSYDRLWQGLGLDPLKGAWIGYSREHAGGDVTRLWLKEPPEAHRQFCADNRTADLAAEHLLVRGHEVPDVYCSGQSVMMKQEGIWGDSVAWKLKIETKADDIIISPAAFVGVGFDHRQNDDPRDEYMQGGLWLLRPHGKPGHFRLLHVLLWRTSESRLFHSWWYIGESMPNRGRCRGLRVHQLAIMAQARGLAACMSLGIDHGQEKQYVIV